LSSAVEELLCNRGWGQVGEKAWREDLCLRNQVVGQCCRRAPERESGGRLGGRHCVRVCVLEESSR